MTLLDFWIASFLLVACYVELKDKQEGRRPGNQEV